MKKTSVLSAIISAFSILIGTISDKVMSFYSGAEGLVLLSQFKNIFSVFRTFSNGALNDGIMKYVSEYKDNPIVDKYIETAIKISLIASFFFGIILVVFSKTISVLFLFSNEYYYLFVVFGLSLPMISLYDVIMSIILGFKDIKRFFFLSFKTLLLSLIITLLLTYFYNFNGAVFSIIIQVVIGFFLILFTANDYRYIIFKFFSSKIDYSILKKYSKFFLITLSIMVLSPLVFMWQREIIVSNSEISTAGYWQAMFRIYSVGLIFVQTTMRRYLLPELSSNKEDNIISLAINKTIKVIIPVLLLLIIVLFLFKHLIIQILFSSEFLVIERIYGMTLLISIIEILSWVFSVWMISKEMYKSYLTSTIIYGFIYLLLTYLLVGKYNLEGIVFALFISKLVQLVFNYFLYKRKKLK